MNLFRPQRYAAGDQLEVEGVVVRLAVNPRASRVSLRLDAARREAVATAPSLRRLGEAVAFAHQRGLWLQQKLAALPEGLALAPGMTISVLGEPCRLEAAPGRARAKLISIPGEPLRIAASGEPDAFARGVVRVLKAHALSVLSERSAAYAVALDRPPPVVAVNDPHARWGSCTPPRRVGFGASVEVGRIRYSWRLVMAPYAVADYVAAHECCHLIEANHGPKFWALVHGLVGDHRPYRDWLRAHGPALHAFGR